MWQSVKEYARAVFKRWWGLVSVVSGIIGIILNILQRLAVPIWVWIAIIAVGLFIAQFLAFHKLRVEQAQLHENWIDAYKSRYGKFPPIPKYLLPVVEEKSYSPGEPISKAIRVKIASGQIWYGLLPTQQQELLELVEWLGQDRRDYEAQVLRMLPKKAPKGAARWKP